jgi:hypothetical protein
MTAPPQHKSQRCQIVRMAQMHSFEHWWSPYKKCCEHLSEIRCNFLVFQGNYLKDRGVETCIWRGPPKYTAFFDHSSYQKPTDRSHESSKHELSFHLHWLHCTMMIMRIGWAPAFFLARNCETLEKSCHNFNDLLKEYCQKNYLKRNKKIKKITTFLVHTYVWWWD